MADTWLSTSYAHQRTLRLADGPDEVHRDQLARLEQRRHQNTDPARTGGYAGVMIADGLTAPGLPL